MEKHFYLSGKYYQQNQSYHAEDSSFKYNNIIKLLKKNNFEFSKINTVTEVGCGAGHILLNAKKSKIFKSGCKFEGYDTNPDAINIAKNIDKDINFFNSDYLETSNSRSDLIFAADVFEHVENPFNFLRKLKKKGNFFVFNIPLEISFLSMVRNKNIFENSFKKVGHLHFYNKRTAMLILKNCGFEIIDCDFAKNRFFELRNKSFFKRLLIYFPQYVFEKFNKNLSCSIFGGYSLVTLAKAS